MRGWLGVDVGARRLHLALVAADGSTVLAVAPPDGLVTWLAGAGVGLHGVAVDAPAAWADDAHADDDRVAPKYRRRCAEAVLAMREPPHYVSWPSPAAEETGSPAHDWVEVGIGVHGALRRVTAAPVDECWPHAAWQRLTGSRRLPSKSTPAGLARRRDVLTTAGLDRSVLRGAGHDHLDAAVAAFTAATVDSAERVRASCPDPAHPGRHHGIVLPTRAVL